MENQDKRVVSKVSVGDGPIIMLSRLAAHVAYCSCCIFAADRSEEHCYRTSKTDRMVTNSLVRTYYVGSLVCPCMLMGFRVCKLKRLRRPVDGGSIHRLWRDAAVGGAPPCGRPSPDHSMEKLSRLHYLLLINWIIMAPRKRKKGPIGPPRCTQYINT